MSATSSPVSSTPVSPISALPSLRERLEALDHKVPFEQVPLRDRLKRSQRYFEAAPLPTTEVTSVLKLSSTPQLKAEQTNLPNKDRYLCFYPQCDATFDSEEDARLHEAQKHRKRTFSDVIKEKGTFEEVKKRYKRSRKLGLWK